jgi:hypothetical protein
MSQEKWGIEFSPKGPLPGFVLGVCFHANELKLEEN